MTDAAEDETRFLQQFLQRQRDSVFSIVDGLEEEDWHRSAVPSGWTVAGFVGHLGNAERHWFQGVVAGANVKLPWDEGLPPYDPKAAFTIDRPSAEVLAYYRDQCRRSDEILAGTSLSDLPIGQHSYPVSDVRWVVLHMIEETAAHSGHLEIARELLDGRTGLGLR
jgi:uncharacterized damage-inducible protein DinB